MGNFSFSLLDTVRINEGLTKCREYFYNTLIKNRALGLQLINDSRVTFPCLFTLIPVIKELNIQDHLKRELKEAVNFAQNTLDHIPYRTDDPLQCKAVLKWILDSGVRTVNLGPDFNEIIDVASSILTNKYKDFSYINKYIDLIFLRNRNNENYHDLVWCVFQFNSVHIIKRIALRLNSEHIADVKLARKLLNYNKGSYTDFIKEFSRNEAFIYFTGESFQLSSKPAFFKTDYSSKYLCKSKRTDKFSDGENERLKEFQALSEEDQDKLSDYSFALSKTDRLKWGEFISSGLSYQLQRAKEGIRL